MEKYIAYLDILADEGTAPVIGIKYDYRKVRLSIGGYARFRRSIVTLMEKFFGKSIEDRGVKESRPQVNKIRFDVMLGSRAFYHGISELEKAGVQVKLTRSLERIMR